MPTKPQRHYESVPCPVDGRLVYYLRFSNIRQADTTIEKQRDNCNVFASRHSGWRKTQEYEEPARTAKHDDIDQRPIFAQLLKDATAGMFDIVVVDSLDRWGRAEAAQFVSLGILREAGVYWATADGQWNSENIRSSGFAQAFAIGVSLGAQTSRDISRKVTDGKRTRARQGYHQNAVVPYGYRRAAPVLDERGHIKRRELEPDPEQWPILQQIKELRLQGWTLTEIARDLNDHGYRFPYPIRNARRASIPIVLQPNRPFLTSTIQSIVNNRFYVEYTPGCGMGTLVRDPRGVAEGREEMQGRHVAAWDQATYQRMRQVAAQLNRTPRANRVFRHRYPLAGLLVCHYCGKKINCLPRMKYNSAGERIEERRTYICRVLSAINPHTLAGCASPVRSVPSEIPHAAFGAILERFQAIRWQEAVTQWLDAEADQDDGAALAKERERLTALQKRLNLQHRAGGIDDEEYARETTLTQQALRALPAPQPAAARRAKALDGGRRMAEMATCWDYAPDAEKSQMAALLIEPLGLTWDMGRRRFTAITPYADYLPSFAVALGWPVEDGVLRWQEEEL